VKRAKGEQKIMKNKSQEICLIEYPVMFVSIGEAYLKLIFEKEDGCVDVVELPLISNDNFPCIQKSLQFSDERNCVVFEKVSIPTSFLHGSASYEYVFKNAFVKRDNNMVRTQSKALYEVI
jgi:hypothetical protein